jgi:heme exporter protein D|tara:strand:- start:319 stop:498 length:180 start_codon:yes stop_codon:yes gene_type:complete
MNWTEFFEMGGYAFYVWSAWGITALVMGWQVGRAKYRKRQLYKDIRRQIQREQKHATAS